MTTENDEMQELPPRSVKVLLSLDTYQGMSDAEIESLIEWHKKTYLIEATNAAELNAHARAMNEAVENNVMAMQSIESMVQSIVSRQVPMGVIASEQA